MVLSSLQKTSPHRRVALVTFNNEVKKKEEPAKQNERRYCYGIKYFLGFFELDVHKSFIITSSDH